jgi:hypothetical protein
MQYSWFLALIRRSALAIALVQFIAPTKIVDAACAKSTTDLGCGGCGCRVPGQHGCDPGYCGQGCEWDEYGCIS